MNSRIKHIGIVILAVIILIVGNGVNYIEYCCNACKAEGVEMLMSGNSCDHEHAVINHLSCCENNLQQDENSSTNCNDIQSKKCQLKRFNVDQVVDINSKLSHSFHFSYVAIIYYFNIIPQLENVSSLPKSSFPSIGYVQDTGRQLLSRICILII